MVITVQPESGRKADSVGTDSTAVGAGLGSLVAVEVGVACTWGRHPTRLTAMSSKNRNNFFIGFSVGKYPAILPAKD